MRVVFVHGACVRDGAWWWSRMPGTDAVAVELPSCERPGADLYDDVGAVRAVLADGVPSVLVGHSYGGVVITDAADTGDVRHLVYVAAAVPDVGESLSTFGGGPVPPYLDVTPDGTFSVHREMLRDLFLYDCDEAAVAGALDRLVYQNVAVTTQPVRHAGWRHVPSTYVVCAGDRATPPEAQRGQAKRTGTVVELPTGHHPMLSHPELLAALL